MLLRSVWPPPDLDGAVAADLQAFADRCYAWMVGWFGAPRDAEWPHRVVYGPFGQCWRARWGRKYYIIVNRTYQANEQRFSECAKILYDRVTRVSPGLGQAWWVRTMMKFLAAQAALRREGMGAYAEHALAHLAEGPAPVLGDLKRTERSAIPWWARLRAHPRDYCRTVARIGTELENAVGWEAICKLPGSTHWQEWLAGLPAGAAERAAAILEIKR